VSAVVSAGCKLGRSNSSTQHRQRGRRRRGWRGRGAHAHHSATASSCGRWHRGRWHRGRAGQRGAAGCRGWQRRRRLC
jgi:hypothetical protein